MGLLSPQDEATLKEHLSPITIPVQLVLFTQAFGGSESGDVAKQILNEIASLNDKSRLSRRASSSIPRTRRNTTSTRRRRSSFSATASTRACACTARRPAMNSSALVEAIMVAGTAKIELDPETMKWIQAVDKPTHIQVFSTPT